MNVPTSLPGLPLGLALAAAVLGFGILSGFAAESKLYVLWDTISPDGNYAMACSTTGAATLDEMPLPDETEENPVSNYVIQVASRKIVLTIPGGHYWRLYGGGQPNHFSLETVWSENSHSNAGNLRLPMVHDRGIPR